MGDFRSIRIGLLAATFVLTACSSSEDKAGAPAVSCSDGSCSDPAHPFCDPVSHTCVGCVDDNSCGSGAACLMPQHECGCQSSVDCATSRGGPRCLQASHACGCDRAADCAMARTG